MCRKFCQPDIMRLGQLSRQLDLKPKEILDYLAQEHQIELEERPNLKLEDEHVKLVEGWIAEQEQKELAAKEATEKAEQEMQAAKEAEKEAAKETAEADTQDPDEIFIVPEGERETIKAPKVELEGLKVKGKIELDEEEVNKAKEAAEKSAARRQKERESGPSANRVSKADMRKERERLKKTGQAGDFETEKSKRQELKEFRKQQREEEAYKKEQQKQHYLQNRPTPPKKKKPSKKKVERQEEAEKVAQEIQVQEQRVQENPSWIKRFFRWWRES